MSKLPKIELVKRLFEIGAIKFGEFTLKSGKKSPYYIDLRILPSYPSVLIDATRTLKNIFDSQSEPPSRLCGVPMAGLAIANVLGIETNIPVVYARKEPIIYNDLAKKIREFVQAGKYQENEIGGVEKVIKTIEELSGFKTHGISRFIDGIIQKGDKIGIVDDLITTADSKLEVRDLIMLEAKRRNIDVDVTGVYVILDREQGGKEALEKEGINLYSLATIREAAKWLHDLGTLSYQLYKTILDYTTAESKAVRINES